MSWVIVIAVLIVIGFVLEREIYFYEGVHLGPRVQSCSMRRAALCWV
jgi:hypothetical protein